VATTVLGVRLEDAGRAQVEAAARRLGLSVSQFARQALLAESARVGGKVSAPAKVSTEDSRSSPEAPQPRKAPIVLVDEPERHWRLVDGLLVMPDGRILDPPDE
jgi:hypothetical protein